MVGDCAAKPGQCPGRVEYCHHRLLRKYESVQCGKRMLLTGWPGYCGSAVSSGSTTIRREPAWPASQLNCGGSVRSKRISVGIGNVRGGPATMGSMATSPSG